MSLFRRLCPFCLALLTLMFAYGRAFGQSDPGEIGQVLGEEILAPGVALHQIKSYILSRAAPPPAATNAQQWTEEGEIAFRGPLQTCATYARVDRGQHETPGVETLSYMFEMGNGLCVS